eukprot:2488662-Prymnesium_polylepis.1
MVMAARKSPTNSKSVVTVTSVAVAGTTSKGTVFVIRPACHRTAQSAQSRNESAGSHGSARGLEGGILCSGSRSAELYSPEERVQVLDAQRLVPQPCRRPPKTIGLQRMVVVLIHTHQPPQAARPVAGRHEDDDQVAHTNKSRVSSRAERGRKCASERAEHGEERVEQPQHA